MRILYGVIQDGGGWTTGGPVPPWGPDQDLLVGLLAATLAETLPGAVGSVRAEGALRFVSLRVGEMLQNQGQRAGEAGGVGLRGFLRGMWGPWGMRARGTERAAFKRMVRIIAQSQRAAGPAQELVGGLLAASLARRQGGSKGGKHLGEALQFVGERAQEVTAAAPTR